MGSDEKLLKPVKDPILAGVRWVKSRKPQEKTALGVGAGLLVRRSAFLPTQQLASSSPPEDHSCGL